MTTNPPESVNSRLIRLENLCANIAETVVAHNNTIDVLVANISQLTENLNNLAEQTARNINNLVEQAAQDRQQAAIDRQEFRSRMDSLAEQAAQDREQAAIDRQRFSGEIRQIWEYLRDRNGGSSTPT
jgi:peptidoglycan hydrolase CwlO-like protein